jgi:Domain of unknown function (DUF3471)
MLSTSPHPGKLNPSPWVGCLFRRARALGCLAERQPAADRRRRPNDIPESHRATTNDRKRTIAIRLADRDCRTILGAPRSRPTVAGGMERRVDDMVAAMSESGSLLEQRIRNMVRKKTKYAHATAAALASLGIAFAVGAAKISPPNNDDPGKSASQESAADSRILDGHVGFYQLNDHAVMTVTRNGQQLNAQLTGQKALPIYARSNTEFSYKDAQISFVTEPDGQTTSLILHEYGVNMPMKRIDAATAQRITSIRAEQPAGGGRPMGKGLMGGALIILR